jgi:hypothetical protein
LGAGGGGGLSGGRADQVPEVAVEVLEHGDGAVGLLRGRADAAHAFGGESVVVGATSTCRLYVDEGEAEDAREPGDRLVIVADDVGDVGEG